MKAAEAGIVRWLVRVSCAVALVFLGFAHQAPAFANGAFISVELSEYVLPDGTVPVICTVGKAQTGDHQSKVDAHGCEACRISASVVLPAPISIALRSVAIPISLGPRSGTEADGSGPLSPAGGPRGPPLNPGRV
ncbi:hypothetical protein [Rhizobium sp. AN80A]|uniref:hypothetical protein n=1 Tax=Rhizobium sp. AN80A TaxID=3040673 RepID=UPI0024B3B58F|nr:hypothetical protein [Rhizobium sp. AN80A]